MSNWKHCPVPPQVCGAQRLLFPGKASLHRSLPEVPHVGTLEREGWGGVSHTSPSYQGQVDTVNGSGPGLPEREPFEKTTCQESETPSQRAPSGAGRSREVRRESRAPSQGGHGPRRGGAHHLPSSPTAHPEGPQAVRSGERAEEQDEEKSQRRNPRLLRGPEPALSQRWGWRNSPPNEKLEFASDQT